MNRNWLDWMILVLTFGANIYYWRKIAALPPIFWCGLLTVAIVMGLLISHRAVSRFLRRTASNHDWFLFCGLILLMIGTLAEILRLDSPSPILGMVMPITGCILTFLGFLFSIYSIRGLFERVRDMAETIDRAAMFLSHDADENTIVVLVGEYPAWGCLSETRKCEEWLEVYRQVSLRLGREKLTVILVAPPELTMNDHIATYARDYAKSQRDLEQAVALNSEFMKVLRLGTRFKHHEATPSAPRYQMILIGKKDASRQGRYKIIPRRAIVWLAPLSSEGLVDYAVFTPDLTSERLRISPRNVLAWEIEDRKTLHGLLDYALFFANIRHPSDEERFFP